MKKTLGICFFFTLAIVCFGQEQEIDSLLNLLPVSPDMKKIEILNDVSRLHWGISLEKSAEYAAEALQIAEEIKSRKGIADALNRLGNAEYYLSNYEKARNHYIRSLRIREEIEDYEGIIASSNNLAVLFYASGNTDKSLEYYLKALDISRQIDNQSEIAEYSVNVGSTLVRLHRPDEAKSYLEDALDIYLEIDDPVGTAEAYNHLGSMKQESLNFGSALEFHLKAFSIYDEIQSVQGLAITYNNIGLVYSRLEKEDLALDYFLNALTYFQKIPGHKLGHASALNNIGTIYQHQKDYSKALDYYEQVLDIYMETRNESGMATVFHNIGMIQMDLKDYQEALESYMKSVEIHKRRNDRSALANNYNNVGELYLLQGNNHKALQYLKEASSIAEGINAMNILLENYNFQSKAYSNLRNYREALNWSREYRNLKNRVFNLESQNRIMELHVRFEADHKSKEIELLRRNTELQELRLSRQRFQRHFFLLIIGLIIILILIVQNKSRIRIATNKLLMERNKQLEDLNLKLKESEKEQLMIGATKDKFFSIIAHDLKNPFNALLSFSEMLHGNIREFTQDEIRAYVEIIQKSTSNLYLLLENLLHWSSTQTGKIDYHPETFTLNSFVHQIIQIMRLSAQKKNISISSEIDPSLEVHADKNLLSTVIRNLIGNAIKFTYENGKIHVLAVQTNGEVKIAVTDDGIGIDPDDLDKLFRIDFNVTNLGTSDEKGTGLGLILCKEFVEKNGGIIWAESKPGEGSSFQFTIPAKSGGKE
jgi:signal transduction histidine kinase/Tfp pilus assembly protein PilF